MWKKRKEKKKSHHLEKKKKKKKRRKISSHHRFKKATESKGGNGTHLARLDNLVICSIVYTKKSLYPGYNTIYNLTTLRKRDKALAIQSIKSPPPNYPILQKKKEERKEKKKAHTLSKRSR
jgi:hypothetical protein